MKADKLLYMKRELQGKSPKELAELWQGLGYDFPPTLAERWTETLLEWIEEDLIKEGLN